MGLCDNSVCALLTMEETTLPVNIANSTGAGVLAGIAWLYWIRPPGYRYMISTYLFALTEIQGLLSSLLEYFFHALYTHSSDTHTHTHAGECGTNVYIPEILSPHNGKKASEISSSPPCSSPRLILLIISSLVLLCGERGRRKTSASWEEVFINISI